MSSSLCPICREDYKAAFEVKVLRSEACGHVACSRCLSRVGGVRSDPSQKGGLVWVDESKPVNCPTCQAPVMPEQWEDTTNEINVFERESLIRARVMSVLNVDRKSFESTPVYNNFLEEREDIIFDLVFSSDENVRKDRAEYLKQYELDHQASVLEALERQKRHDEETVKDIVAKEGTFYEMVKQNYGPGFLHFKTNAKLVHPLKRDNPQYFPSEDQANNARQKNNGPTPPPSALGGHGILNKLFAMAPTRLNVDNQDQPSANAKRKDYKLVWEAGGHQKAAVAKRTAQETYGAFRYDKALDI